MPAKASTTSTATAKATSRGKAGKPMKITVYLKPEGTYYGTPKKLLDYLGGAYWLEDISRDWAVTVEAISPDEFEKAMS